MEECCFCTNEYGVEIGHDMLRLRCGHEFGASCIRRWFSEKQSCPLCREAIDRADVQGEWFSVRVVDMVTGSQTPIYVHAMMTCNGLQRIFQEYQNLAGNDDNVQLVWGGRVLHGDFLLYEYNLAEGTRIVAVVNLRGD